MIDLIHAWRHLFSAVVALATDSGQVTERLKLAYFDHLVHISPNPHLSEDLQADFAALMNELRSAYPDRQADSGAVDAARGSRLAKRVVSLYEAVTRKL
ncbi:hypothetical protein SVA_2200 [Sulfurifustis variabilis]|uniref:Uncharacterized protein n=1 Tax=Sulfurifustis variabilis TaxID=1675686 RepID=A0A1B4V5E5_9GAMM|nr:hypothetical protein [Sulfurifustis variabilis]BAU48750.1 hypothetical protein SVA_2200 [Sulfurifustis variabilis]